MAKSSWIAKTLAGIGVVTVATAAIKTWQICSFTQQMGNLHNAGDHESWIKRIKDEQHRLEEPVNNDLFQR